MTFLSGSPSKARQAFLTASHLWGKTGQVVAGYTILADHWPKIGSLAHVVCVTATPPGAVEDMIYATVVIEPGELVEGQEVDVFLKAMEIGFHSIYDTYLQYLGSV